MDLKMRHGNLKELYPDVASQFYPLKNIDKKVEDFNLVAIKRFSKADNHKHFFMVDGVYLGVYLNFYF